MHAQARAAIALGSNLVSSKGDSTATVLAAIAQLGRLPGTSVLASSGLHTTLPVGPPQPPYINACVLVATSLGPRELLAHILSIERAFGRDRSREQRWGPRILDLDMIAFEDQVIEEPGLHVPHPRMHERVFVLAPLAEVWPEWVHPVLHTPVRELLAIRKAAVDS